MTEVDRRSSLDKTARRLRLRRDAQPQLLDGKARSVVASVGGLTRRVIRLRLRIARMSFQRATVNVFGPFSSLKNLVVFGARGELN